MGARSSKTQVAASNEQLTAAQVLDLGKRFQDATIASDAATIAKLMAEDAMFVRGNALVQRKAEFEILLTVAPGVFVVPYIFVNFFAF